MVAWYSFYLKNRVVTATVRGTTIMRLLKRGVLQGGILSPMAWNENEDRLLDLFSEFNEDKDSIYPDWDVEIDGEIVADGLGSTDVVVNYPTSKYRVSHDETGNRYLDGRMVNEDPLVNGFADDVNTVVEGTDPVTVQLSAQWAVDQIAKWVQEAGLELSPAKSVAVFFTRSRDVEPPSNIHIGGQELERQPQARYLGVTLDQKLNFRAHIDKKIKEARMSLMRLKSSIGKLWGPRPYLARWAYLCVVRPALTFGHFVWGHRISTRTLRRKLGTVQSEALRLCGHFRKSTPTAALDVIFNVLPLDIHIEFEITRSYLRLRDKLCGPLYPDGHVKAARMAFESSEVVVGQRDEVDLVVPHRAFTVVKNSFGNGKLAEDDDRVLVFTDGSKNREGKTGLGYLVQSSACSVEGSLYLGQTPTVYQAEALAIMEACRPLKDRLEFAGKKVTIYSDSQSVLQALMQRRVKSKTIWGCIMALNSIGQTASVRLRWIKGHSGVPGNERADSLAKRAVQDESPLPSYRIPEPAVSHTNLLREVAMKRWKKRWSSLLASGHARQSGLWFPAPSQTVTASLLKEGRESLSRVVRWLTGHAFLRMQNWRAETVTSSLCR